MNRFGREEDRERQNLRFNSLQSHPKEAWQSGRLQRS